MSTAPVFPTNIGIPRDVELSKWCVIAADQFSASSAYWSEVEQVVGQAPSTLRMIVPEAYLTTEDEQALSKRIAVAQDVMDYYRNSYIHQLQNSVIYTERKTPFVKKRKSLVLALDLEAYSYTADPLDARASEATVLERIPAREALRRAASLELPHVQVLYDDPNHDVEKQIDTSNLEPIYSTDLMLDGGSVSGWQIRGESETWLGIKTVLDGLIDQHGFRFIVGDGNHSLAAAKSHWEHLKPTLSSAQLESHPARYALVELINVHDAGLVMEPIHRLLRGISESELTEFTARWNQTVTGKSVQLQILTKQGPKTLNVIQPGPLVVEPVQKIIDHLIDELHLDPAYACEYVHGTDELTRLVNEHDGIGIKLPALHRSSLFEYVANNGAMPRKSFSLGEAVEKRYYLETREIVLD